MWLRGCEWHHAPEACAEDLGDLRKVSRVFASEEGWLSELAEALRRGAARGGGADEKVCIERLCISLLMSKKLLTQR